MGSLMLKQFNWLVSCLAISCGPTLAMPGAAPARAAEVCEAGGALLASCSSNPHTFRSVVLAIPGWNGNCGTGIGEGERNLLNSIRQVSFFDVDCFDFKPHDVPFETIEADLEARLVTLRNAGYTDVAIITHSTGGIIATDVLLNQAFGDGDTLIAGSPRARLLGGDGPRLRGLYTWAIPMNGLTDQVDFLQWLGNLFQASPALLPKLAPGSDFLKSKHALWVAYAMQADSLSDFDKATFEFPWVIFQGQDDDFVVRPISRTDPWLPSWARPVDVEAFHTDMVSDSGFHDLPKYPAEVMSKELVASLPFTPRYEELFASDTPNAESIRVQQRQILAAIVEMSKYYNLFSTIAPHIDLFVAKLLTGDHIHDAAFDQEAVVALTGLIDRTIATQGDDTVIRFADEMLTVIERSFPAEYQVAGMRSFGGGSALGVRALADGVDRLCKHVLELTDGSTLVSALTVSGTRAEFDRKYGVVMGRLFGVQDQPTRQIALASVDSNLGSLGPSAFQDTQLVQALANYARVQPGRDKTLAGVLLKLQLKSPELNELVLQQMLPEPSTRPGDDALWNKVFDNDDALVLLEQSEDVGDDLTGRLQLLQEMVARGSVDGRTSVLGNAALKQYEILLQPSTSEMAAAGLVEAISESRFHGLEINGAKLLENKGYGQLLTQQ